MQPKHKRLAIAALLVAIMGFSSLTYAQAAPKRVEITASQFSFSPGEITLKKGQPVLLVIKSQDVAHGLRVRELNIALKVNEHGTAQVQFTPQKTGDFVGHCYVFCGKGHGSMVLSFHVVD
ncbi:MAG: cupredoxin domain-containing protein [Acidobacteria bacterium]|nr:cupredoxin domain-containing protein [Acidobacteriota bacterium]